MGERGGITVVFSGGGTGGHLYPALALAQALSDLRPDVRPFFVGACRGIEARVLPQRGVEHVLLPVEGFQRGNWRANGSVLPNLLRSLATVGTVFRTLRPELAVVTGGYAGGPAGLVAAAMGVPMALQEQNAVPGVTTRALSLRARQVHLAFPEARDRLPRRARSRVRISGNPVRPSDRSIRPEARERLGFTPEQRVLLVVGGSQGSQALNRVVAEVVEGLSAGTLDRAEEQVLYWSTGPTNYEPVREELNRLGNPEWVRAVPYIDDMADALAAADLALSRAGAMTTSEFLAWGLPAVMVPLPTSAEDHQRLNAEALERAGAGIMVPEAGLQAQGLWHRVRPLLDDRAALERMEQQALARGRPNAATEIASALATLLPANGRAAR